MNTIRFYFYGAIIFLVTAGFIQPLQAKPFIFLKAAQYAQQVAPSNPDDLATLTMEQAVSYAHSFKPNLTAYRHIIQLRRIEKEETWNGYYPQISLSGTTQYQRPNNAVYPGITVQANIDQLVFDPAGPQLLSKRAQKNVAIERLHEQRDKNDTQLQVELAFLDCWRLQQQVKQLSALSDASVRDFKKALNQKHVELLSQNDFLQRVETHAGNASTVYQFDDQIKILQRRLEYLMGRTVMLHMPKFQLESEPAPSLTRLQWDGIKRTIMLAPLSFYHEQAMRCRPEIQEQQKLIEIEEDSYNIARSSRLPKINASGIAGRNDVVTLIEQSKGYYSVNLTAKWSLFDGRTSDIEAEKAHARKLAAVLNKQEVMNLVKFDVEQAYHATLQELTKFKAEQYRYLRAKNEFFLSKKQFEAGLISPATFAATRNTFEVARFAWLNQKVEIAKQERTLLHHCGYYA